MLISIIIPTIRFKSESFETVFQMAIPENYELEYILIIDNPSQNIDKLKELINKYPQNKVELIRNKKNLGVSVSRNKGIEKSKGNFILFLDDDCIFNSNLLEEFIKVYEETPEYSGYIGLTNAPEPDSTFNKAVCLSDMRYFFEIAKYKDEFYWGITANLFLKRDAIGEIRFSPDHPKKGGGEDIAFCLEILANYTRNSDVQDSLGEKGMKFKCVPRAEVIHPFWEENLRGYMRFFRWGYGDVILHKKFPKYRFHQYPNLIEFTFIIILLNLIIFFVLTPLNIILERFLVFLLLFVLEESFMFIWEVSSEAIKLHRNNRKFTVNILIKAVIIRLLNDLGRFFHQFPKIWKITCRWDYFCTRESLKYERKTASLKFFGFLLIYTVSTLITISIFI